MKKKHAGLIGILLAIALAAAIASGAIFNVISPEHVVTAKWNLPTDLNCPFPPRTPYISMGIPPGPCCQAFIDRFVECNENGETACKGNLCEVPDPEGNIGYEFVCSRCNDSNPHACSICDSCKFYPDPNECVENYFGEQKSNLHCESEASRAYNLCVENSP